MVTDIETEFAQKRATARISGAIVPEVVEVDEEEEDDDEDTKRQPVRVNNKK